MTDHPPPTILPPPKPAFEQLTTATLFALRRRLVRIAAEIDAMLEARADAN